MRYRFTFIVLSLFLLSAATYADVVRGTLEREPSAVDCNDEVKRCTYITQNVNARKLLTTINTIMFPGNILSPSEGYINVESLKKLSFWFESEDMLARFVALIPLLDRFEDFVPSDLVQITTEVFSLSEGSLSSLDAQISSGSSNPGDDTPDWSFTTGNGALDLALKVGTNFLSSIIGSRSVKEETSRITKVTQLIPNFGGINYNHTTNVYVSPTAGVVKDEKAGLTIGGNVSINAQDPDLILVKNFSFRYGIITKGDSEGAADRVTVLNVTNPELYLVKGTSSIIVSSVTSESSSTGTWRLLGFGRSKNKLQSKIMVVTRATSIDFNKYIRDLKKLRERESVHMTFSNEQTRNMPTTDVELSKVLKAIKPYSFYSTNGDRKVGFTIDKKLARASNIKKTIQIKFKGGGVKGDKHLTVANLMLSGFKFPDFKAKYLDKSYFKLTIYLKKFKASLRDRVKTVLYYNPETNKFIEE